MENTLPKLHQVNGITYNKGPNTTNAMIINSFDAYHKAIEWFLHHMNGLVLFRRYIRSLDTLELWPYREDGLDMQERTLENLLHWEQRGLGPGPTLHHHGLQDVQTRLFVSFRSLFSTF